MYFKKTCNKGKLYLIPKIHKRLLNVPVYKITSDSSKENVAFLDLKVKLKQGKIEMDLHVKPKDRHQYLHYTSSHPEIYSI